MTTTHSPPVFAIIKFSRSVSSLIVFEISSKLGRISSDYCNFAKELLCVYKLDYKIPASVKVENLIAALLYDKKVKNGKVRFVLPVEYCGVDIFEDVPSDLLESVVKELY